MKTPEEKVGRSISIEDHNKEIGETRKSYSNYIQCLEIALEESIKGLKWKMDNDPKSMDKSDYEKIDEWTALIHELHQSPNNQATFKIFNNTRVIFGFMDRIRILFGKQVTISVTIHADREVEVLNKETEHSITVKPFFKPKQTYLQFLSPDNTTNN